MTWYILIVEGLLIIAIIVWMFRKLKAMRMNDADEESPQQGAENPTIDLPDEEKWE